MLFSVENYTRFKRTAPSMLLEPDRDETPEDKTFINHVVKIIHHEMGSAKITKSYNYASPKKKNHKMEGNDTSRTGHELQSEGKNKLHE